MNYAGIDIGGANIKFASLDGQSNQIAFPIWKNKSQLTEVLKTIANSLAPTTSLGVTMTAELADCFESKQSGVEFIVRAVVESFPNQNPLFYRTDGVMCDPGTAIQQWRSVAASNWHALARLAFGDPDNDAGFVFDVGSTTSDIIPVEHGRPVIGEQGDFERLANGQLIYAGVGRTPVCSIISSVQLGSRRVTIARELFATMSDVFLCLDQLAEDESSSNTADGRPATKRHAGRRLARMVCADFDELGIFNINEIALQAKQALVYQLSIGLAMVVSQNPTLPLTFRTFGKGSWLVGDVIDAAFESSRRSQTNVISFSENETKNQTAPAFAIAAIRREVDLGLGLLDV